MLVMPWTSKVRYWEAKMTHLGFKMTPLGAFWEPEGSLEESKILKNEILGALGGQSRVLEGPYGALGIEKGAPGCHFGSQK